MNVLLGPVLVSQFGKDHWSLLGYVNCCFVAGKALDKRRMRTNGNKHPLHNVNGFKWNPEHGTRLAGYFDKRDPALKLSGHDDWDCLNDLEAAGILEVISEANAIVSLTDAGKSIADRLREHKAMGGNFADFRA